MIGLAVALILSIAAAWVGTGLVRGYALHRNLVDVPNHRSSHSVPTPRGGGLAVASVVLTATMLLTIDGQLSLNVGAGLLGGGVLVAGIGWFDDHRHIPAKWRALAHFLAATWAVYLMGAPEVLWLGTTSLPLGPAGPLLMILGLMWLTNLFNFMDGIDGLASTEAAMVAGFGGVMLLMAGVQGLGTLALVVTAAAIGFLIWNWPPARIFLGDVGSGLLGFFVGGIAIAASVGEAVPLVVWTLLLGVFLFDATITLIRRIAKGERFFEAHRRHAYQRAVQAGYTHLQVTMTVLTLNSILAGLAIAAWRVTIPALLAVTSALGLLLVAYFAVEQQRPMWRVTPGGGSREQPKQQERYREETGPAQDRGWIE